MKINNNKILKILINAIKKSTYSYIIDNDVCGCDCCSETVELIDIDKLIKELENENK